ncbi:MAG: hypothetical protein ACK44C_09960 [Polaromonas sp.]
MPSPSLEFGYQAGSNLQPRYAPPFVLLVSVKVSQNDPAVALFNRIELKFKPITISFYYLTLRGDRDCLPTLKLGIGGPRGIDEKFESEGEGVDFGFEAQAFELEIRVKHYAGGSPKSIRSAYATFRK